VLEKAYGVASSGFRNGTAILRRFTCEGEDLSTDGLAIGIEYTTPGNADFLIRHIATPLATLS
jgi:hypothetical protein